MTREIVFNNTDREKFEVKKSCGGIMKLIHRRSCHLVRKTKRYQLASLDGKKVAVEAVGINCICMNRQRRQDPSHSGRS
jgi:hypothetical protein